ncbi:MAG: ABC transporter permease [Bacillota bacterium]
MFQFLVEAVTTSGLGGILGILLGYAASIVIGKVMGTQTSVSMDMALAAFSFSAIVGVVFGIFPANKAAGLKPVEALRHD